MKHDKLNGSNTEPNGNAPAPENEYGTETKLERNGNEQRTQTKPKSNGTGATTQWKRNGERDGNDTEPWRYRPSNEAET